MENLTKKDAAGKLKELISDIEICMMVTGWNTAPFCAVPMTTKKVDKAGNIWFASLKNSEHNKNIANNENVELLYSDPSRREFLSVSGKAKIHENKAIIEELYGSKTEDWCNGIDDSKLTAIEIVPGKAFYWDVQTNKYETLYHLGIAALTEEEKHESDKGELKL